MTSRFLAVNAVLIALLAIIVTPAKANHIDTATATVGCSSYSITVSASALADISYTINWSIILTPTSGSPITVTGSTGPFSGASGTYSNTFTNPLGPVTGNFTLSGSAELVGFNSIPITFTNPSASLSCPGTPPCTDSTTTNTSNFNGTPINAGNYIWFNANFSASGIPSTGATLTFTNSTISFTAGGTPYNLAVPNATITFSPSAICPSLTYDSLTNTFTETVPIAGSDEIFLTGLAFPVPSGFGQVTGNVAWTGTLASSVAGISIKWKWGAAVYTTFTTNYNLLNIKPMHNNIPNTCSTAFNNSDHAGTPEGVDATTGEPWKSFVTGGARGGGGSNFTGSWSGTISFTPTCIIS